MSQDNREDICKPGLEYMSISLIAKKVHVLIVGGGQAGFIKAKTFSEKGCCVSILSPDFYEEFHSLKNNIVLIKENYSKDYIADKHIIVIATDDIEVNRRIKCDCEETAKLYLTCHEGSEGMFVTPVQVETKSVHIAINSKGKSPKTAVFIGNMLQKSAKEYDEFASYICSLRERLKGTDIKDDVMGFVNTEDFYYFFNIDKHRIVLKMYYGGENIEF